MNAGGANASFSATLVDQWIACGLRAAFVAPGSRSTPLAVALAARSEIRLELFHDERSASFAALGWGLASGSPGVVLCTSGTAATHFHGAVAEASASCIPMIVCTADRPPELWGIGAPQTINQHDLYANSVRAFHPVHPPDETDPSGWRELANQVWEQSTGAVEPGPVQVNLSFREPLLGQVGELSTALAVPAPGQSLTPDASEISEVVRRIRIGNEARPGVIVVGRGESEPDAIAALADALGWPIVADHRSGLRDGRALRFHDAILRTPDETTEGTQRILRFGEPLSSKVLGQWIGRIGVDTDAVIGFVPWSRTIDPERVTRTQIPERDAAALLLEEVQRTALSPADAWSERWAEQDLSFAARFDTMPMDEPRIAAEVLASVPDGGALVVSSSMPVRDVEWYGPNRPGVSVYSNRGANGIDGVMATAIGVACIGVPTVCLIGDVAFLHDQGSLTALCDREIDLTIVVVDNDGGGIFSFLPQHEQLDPATYEKLFGTPHGTDLAALATAHGLQVGTDIIIHKTNRAQSLEQRTAFNAP